MSENGVIGADPIFKILNNSNVTFFWMYVVIRIFGYTSLQLMFLGLMVI